MPGRYPVDVANFEPKRAARLIVMWRRLESEGSAQAHIVVDVVGAQAGVPVRADGGRW
jgi:hypothetical protein